MVNIEKKVLQNYISYYWWCNAIILGQVSTSYFSFAKHRWIALGRIVHHMQLEDSYFSKVFDKWMSRHRLCLFWKMMTKCNVQILDVTWQLASSDFDVLSSRHMRVSGYHSYVYIICHRNETVNCIFTIFSELF